jgi:hypothetical protein
MGGTFYRIEKVGGSTQRIRCVAGATRGAGRIVGCRHGGTIGGSEPSTRSPKVPSSSKVPWVRFLIRAPLEHAQPGRPGAPVPASSSGPGSPVRHPGPAREPGPQPSRCGNATVLTVSMWHCDGSRPPPPLPARRIQGHQGHRRAIDSEPRPVAETLSFPWITSSPQDPAGGGGPDPFMKIVKESRHRSFTDF